MVLGENRAELILQTTAPVTCETHDIWRINEFRLAPRSYINLGELICPPDKT